MTTNEEVLIKVDNLEKSFGKVDEIGRAHV